MDESPAPAPDVPTPHATGGESLPVRHLPRLLTHAALLTTSAFAILLPMSQLFRPGLSPRVNDWENSLWAAGYLGRYLSVHHALPAVLNADRFVGNPVPVFYAPLLYPALGAGSAVLGMGRAVRGAAVLAWALQYVVAYRLLRLVTGSRGRAVAGGAMLCWAVYPLTNLYNRGALAEFFGTTLLLCAACAGGLALLEARRRRRVFFALLCGLCGAAAAGSHAITAVVGGAVLACLAPAALRILPRAEGRGDVGRGDVGSGDVGSGDVGSGDVGNVGCRGRDPSSGTDPPHPPLPHSPHPHSPHPSSPPGRLFRRRLAITAGLALAVALVVSPWLYATARFGGRLHAGQSAGVLGWIAEYDTWYVRLSPVPLPTPAGPALSVGIPPTPYLDPQLNAAMLALLLWTLGVTWWARGVRKGRGRDVRPPTPSPGVPGEGRGEGISSFFIVPSLVGRWALDVGRWTFKRGKAEKTKRPTLNVQRPTSKEEGKDSHPSPLPEYREREQQGCRGSFAPALPLLRSSLALFAVFFLVSVVPALCAQLPTVVGSLVQFAYRLVTYQNLTVFTALVAALVLGQDQRPHSSALRRADAIAWAAALALSAAGLAVKLGHASAALGPARAEAQWAQDPDRFALVPDTYYARLDYAVADESRRLYNLPPAQWAGLKSVPLPPGRTFGEAGEAALDEPAPAWRATNVIAFSWNRLVLDGRVLPPEQTRDAPNVLAARVPAGRHTLGYRFQPPATWSLLRLVSLVAGASWLVLLLVLLPWALGPSAFERRHGRTLDRRPP